jgi:hypothetical protein
MREPSLSSDKAFFAANPFRRFRARCYTTGDGPFPSWAIPFADDGTGVLGEVNLVVVKRMVGMRIRALFTAPNCPTLKTDRSIVEFLRSRGIDPTTLKRSGIK